MNRRLIVVLLAAQVLLAGSFVGAQLLERQPGGGFTLFGGGVGASGANAVNAAGQTASTGVGGVMDTANSLAGGVASQAAQMATTSGGLGGMGGGAMRSMGNLIAGLGQDEKGMLQREINVAVRILNLANDRLAATNSLGDLNRANAMQFGSDAMGLAGESVRSLGQPIGSMYNRIMGMGR